VKEGDPRYALNLSFTYKIEPGFSRKVFAERFDLSNLPNKEDNISKSGM